METPIFPLQLFQSDFQNVYEPAEDTFLLIDSLENALELIKSIK